MAAIILNRNKVFKSLFMHFEQQIPSYQVKQCVMFILIYSATINNNWLFLNFSIPTEMMMVCFFLFLWNGLGHKQPISVVKILKKYVWNSEE